MTSTPILQKSHLVEAFPSRPDARAPPPKRSAPTRANAGPQAATRPPRFRRQNSPARGNRLARTIKPVPYPGRTPHIHFAVSRAGRRVSTTQAFIAGHPQNLRDGIFRRLSPADRKLVAVDFKPVENSKLGEQAANFNITLGHTPEDPQEGEKPKGIAPAEFQQRRRS